MTVMTDSAATSSWSNDVENVQKGDQAAIENVYYELRSIRAFLVRRIGPDHADDVYHSLFIDLIDSVQKGVLRNSEALAGYAMMIARRKVYAQIKIIARQRRELEMAEGVLPISRADSPERRLLAEERRNIAIKILNSLPKRDREVILRFYVQEETAEEIMSAMSLTPTQFRLIKSRAKQRYALLVQGRMQRIPPQRAAHITEVVVPPVPMAAC
jgi:RNA polymerase sigma-70 factor, ECF subfamily